MLGVRQVLAELEIHISRSLDPDTSASQHDEKPHYLVRAPSFLSSRALWPISDNFSKCLAAPTRRTPALATLQRAPIDDCLHAVSIE